MERRPHTQHIGPEVIVTGRGDNLDRGRDLVLSFRVIASLV